MPVEFSTIVVWQARTGATAALERHVERAKATDKEEPSPGAPSSVRVTTSKALVTSSDALVTSSFLFLVVRPGATFVACDRSVRRDALCC